MGNGCFGAPNAKTSRRVERVVGGDGYVDWETEMEVPEGVPTLEELGLSPENNISVKDLEEFMMDKILSAFEDGGKTPFESLKSDIEEDLFNIFGGALDKVKDLFDYTPSGKYSYVTVGEYASEVVKQALTNEILVTFGRIVLAKGENMFTGVPDVDLCIREAVVFSYVLHVITMVMTKDLSAGQKILETLVDLRKPGNELEKFKEKVPKTSRMKVRAIEWGLEVFLDENRMKSAELHYAITVNILMAMIHEACQDANDNAEAGYELAMLDGLFDFTAKANKGAVRPKNIYSMYRLSPVPRNWSDLYMSWNLCFVYTYFTTWPETAMKLLNPAVLAYTSDPEVFMPPRGCALEIYGQILIRQYVQGHKSRISTPANPEISSLWGQINNHYAKKYRKFYDDLGRKANSAGFMNYIADGSADRLVEATWGLGKAVAKFVSPHHKNKAELEDPDEKEAKQLVKLFSMFKQLKLEEETKPLKETQLEGDADEQFESLLAQV